MEGTNIVIDSTDTQQVLRMTSVVELKEEKLEDEEQSFLPNFVSQAGKQKKNFKWEIRLIDHLESGSSKLKKISKSKKVVNNENNDIGANVKTLKKKNFFRDESLHLLCEWKDCHETAERMEDFMRHVAGHVREVDVRQSPAPLLDVFACLWTECGFECSSSEEMVRHVHFHSFHTKVKCHGMNMLAANGLPVCKLDNSQRNILPDLSRPFLCEWENCDFWNENWQMPQTFYWHVKNHPEELRGSELKCRWRGCSRVDTAVSKIKEHMRTHSQERQVGCPTCGGMFANRIKFLDHCLRQQVGEKAFTCHTCGKKFTIERHLRDHMRIHISHYKCPHCDMTCTSPSTLTNHIRYRHTEAKPFSCEFCDYRGKTQADIKSHLRVHYNEVEIRCPEEDCKFVCRSKITMKQHHNSVHSANSLRYACHLCETRFDRGAYLTKHLTKVHSFSWPSGHSRFRYTKDQESGLYRLQTIRFEKLDVRQELQGAEMTSPLPVDSQSSDWNMTSPFSVHSCTEFVSANQSVCVQSLHTDFKQESVIQIEEQDNNS